MDKNYITWLNDHATTDLEKGKQLLEMANDLHKVPDMMPHIMLQMLYLILRNVYKP